MILSGIQKAGAVLAMCLLPAVGAAHAAEGDSTNANAGGDPVQFLFIHHSCGGQLLADQGPNEGEQCIYASHPNGGGLRADLTEAGFQVNETSYGSIVGEDTDICHWNAKFRDQMDRILRTRNQDDLLPDGVTNRIVAFKSCFPNNYFAGEGVEPGDPDSCERTVANARAAYRALLPYFEAHPEVLFVAFTAPPNAKTPGFKGWVKTILKGKPKHPEYARQFNNWLADPQDGWLDEYDGRNVVVFDYYDVLTNHGETNWSAYPTGGGSDSHPSSEGNSKAAQAFLPFLQKAWQAHQGASS